MIWPFVLVVAGLLGRFAWATSHTLKAMNVWLGAAFIGMAAVIALSALSIAGHENRDNYDFMFFLILGLPLAAGAIAVFMVSAVRSERARRSGQFYLSLLGLVVTVAAVVVTYDQR